MKFIASGIDYFLPYIIKTIHLLHFLSTRFKQTFEFVFILCYFNLALTKGQQILEPMGTQVTLIVTP